MRKEAMSRPEAGCRKQGQGGRTQEPGHSFRNSQVQWTL